MALPLLGVNVPNMRRLVSRPVRIFVIPESPSFVLNNFQQRFTVVLDHLLVRRCGICYGRGTDGGRLDQPLKAARATR